MIKLAEGASEDDHLRLLGVLNSSTACFWLKQVSHNEGRQPLSQGEAQADQPWYMELRVHWDEAAGVPAAVGISA